MSNFKSIALAVLEKLSTALSDRSATHRHTDRHTSYENFISALHYDHLAELTRAFVSLLCTVHIAYCLLGFFRSMLLFSLANNVRGLLYFWFVM